MNMNWIELNWYRPFKCWDNYEAGDDCLTLTSGRKRPRFDQLLRFVISTKKTELRNYLNCRNDVLGSSWKLLFKVRWPELVNSVEPSADWQQLYWEKHLQKYDTALWFVVLLCFLPVLSFAVNPSNSCVDEAAEVAMRPTFSGRISSIHVSGKFSCLEALFVTCVRIFIQLVLFCVADKILRYICHEEHTNCQKCVCTELSFHFQTFGPYLRFSNISWLRANCSTFSSEFFMFVSYLLQVPEASECALRYGNLCK